MAAVKTLPTDVSKVGAEGNVKLFGRWEAHEVECKDISLTDYIQIRHAVYLPHTAGRYAKKQFKKAQMPIVERLVDSLMMKGRNNGKKLMAVRIVAHAFEIIHLLTDQNPIQVLVDAIVNTGPREDSTRIGSQGTVRRQAVDVSPLRRVNQAVALLTIGVSGSSLFENINSKYFRLARARSVTSSLLPSALLMNSSTQQRALPTRMPSRTSSSVLPSLTGKGLFSGVGRGLFVHRMLRACLRDWIDQPEQAPKRAVKIQAKKIPGVACLLNKPQNRLFKASESKREKAPSRRKLNTNRAVSVHTITLVLLALTPCPAELVAAGGTLEYLKYADALFEILIVGGLLQPGGNFLDDGAPKSPFSVANVPEPVQIDEVKKYVEVFNKLIRRYKYLQRPLEESSLPTLMQYMHRWPPEQKDKVAIATGLMISQGLASASCLQTLTKDSAALSIVTSVFRVILAEQTMDHLSSLLKKGGIKDLLLFFPVSKRTADALLTHFKEANLPQISDWYTKKQTSALKTQLIAQLKEMCENEEPPEAIITAIKEHQAALPETELVQVIWQGLMASVDWSARADQIEGLALREVTVRTHGHGK
ncbi:eukaryotic translation initiation factor 5C [Rhizoctonia solani AG-1 IA]|uniref:Eukaryotic translation initiation factor 5C n=1 Tax=Thanatephorus cucumeris (strain AG1-IA) TaxID=983506 RepID=L8WX92_THACA|nr:eukaryotic translation initiation factor 5C [Rhizoctonia solani AG-1 IA]